MKLKKYQERVLDDLKAFLEEVKASPTPQEAFKAYWKKKEPFSQIPSYKDNFGGAVHVCFKVPTGGGKTYLACNSLKEIFSHTDYRGKLVVWLVPSRSILTQTVNALKSSTHYYRQKLNADFNNHVEVYTKEEALAGQGFIPSTTSDQVSIIIMSYDSLRSHLKEGRNVYKPNGNLHEYPKYYTQKEALIPDVDETALIQAINQHSPVVIVDESHNATSTLSVEMLRNLNPSLILDLTATPRENSNIISFVDALDLKKEDMVKLPVIVNKKNNQNVLIHDVVYFRNILEKVAKKEREASGYYIRPIALLQAETKAQADATTFDRLKQLLIGIGIPEEQIAIKTAEIDQLKSIDLLSEDCPIRYIITINALKEGWDCSFAYLLATLSNQNSAVAVEQILGRILRQPHAVKHSQSLLNMSYVYTASSKFHDAVREVIKGLERAGFSEKDYRIATVEPAEENSDDGQTNVTQIGITEIEQPTEIEVPEEPDSSIPVVEDDLSEILSVAPTPIHTTEEDDDIPESVKKDIQEATEKGEAFEQETAEEGERRTYFGGGLDMTKISHAFQEEINDLEIPVFVIKQEDNVFLPNHWEVLTATDLWKGFTLVDKDTSVDLSLSEEERFQVDAEEAEQGQIKIKKHFFTTSEQQLISELMSSADQEQKHYHATTVLVNGIRNASRGGAKWLADNELRDYVGKIVENMTPENLSSIDKNAGVYAQKIKQKIESFRDKHAEALFYTLIEQNKILSQPHFTFKEELNKPAKTFPLAKSLYEHENNDLNPIEKEIITTVASLENVRWWHRNLDRQTKGGAKDGFRINGGFENAYPDFIVRTNNNVLCVIEVKGAHLENPVTKRKAKLGRKWAELAGQSFKYYMVFKNTAETLEDCVTPEQLVNIIKEL